MDDGVNGRASAAGAPAGSAGPARQAHQAHQAHQAQDPARYDSSTGILFDDAVHLLEAVNTRLRQACLETGPAPDQCASPPPVLPGDAGVREVILDCVTALEQLHATIRDELGRREQLEHEMLAAQDSLAGLRAELAGTREDELRARRLARRDSLTRLPNRGFFLERLEQSLVRAALESRPLAVFFLDLDGFKPVNDTHGHDAGDQLLRIVAARLASATRAEDVVGRLGGDEFACLLLDTPTPQALALLAVKLIDRVSARVSIGELQLSVRPSIGVAIFPEHGRSGEQLLKAADAAMYRAKRQGSGYALFDPGVDG